MDYVFQWGVAAKYIPHLLGGAAISLQLATLGFIFGSTIGLFMGLGKTYGPPWMVKVVNWWVIFNTNTPGLVTGFFIFYGLPEFGILLTPFQTVLLNSTLHSSGYITEIMRGGFLSVRQTEMEAAETLGFSLLQSLRYVIVPHIAKTLFAPLSNFYIFMILGSASAAIFGVEELTGRAINITSETFRTMEIFSIVATMYVIMTIMASAALALIGRWVFRVKAKVF